MNQQEHIAGARLAHRRGVPGAQAVAVLSEADRAIFKKCKFLGWQDTLYAKNGRQYFEDCYIEGNVDFIFGSKCDAAP